MKRLWTPVIALVAVLMGIGFLLLEPVSDSTAIQYDQVAEDNTGGPIQQLQTATNGEVTVSTDPDTGRVLFIGTEPSSPIPQPAFLGPDAGAEEAARGFLSEYGQLFGVTDQASQLAMARTSETGDGRSFVRFQQVCRGVPVLGGELIVQVSAKDYGIISATGETAAAESVDTIATVSSSDAKAAALGAVSKWYAVGPAALHVGEPQLWIYNPSVLGMNQDCSSLVWRTEVADGLLIRELVLVDANLGFVALHFNQVDTAKNRQVYNTNCTSTLPGTLARSEGGAATGNTDVDNAYTYTGYTYDFYWANHERDSIDDAGMTIISTVNFDDDGSGCDYQNAFWNGSQMVFGTGYASALDVVAHELTHGVTDYESQLFYYMQSGAINEAFSDIWGEFTELTYNPGPSSDRWLMGEDLPIGAIRDMQDPTVYGQPDRMTSAYYACGDYWDDNGGVHTNSGVANKAACLMVDGGTFNGYAVTGMGIAKTADLFYEVQTNLLTSAGDYADLYDALQQAAVNLGYSAADRQTVKDAIDAVEMNEQPASCPADEAPVLESGTVNILFSDDLESGSGNWVQGAYSGSSEWYYLASYATSGEYSLWGYDQDAAADYYVAMTSDVALPAGSQPYLHFRHSFEFESNSSSYFYDGGLVEYSTDGGSSWQDAGALFTHNGYTGTIDNSTGNPLGGRSAFVGYSSGYTSSRLDLKPLAGQSVRFRFRIGTDVSVDAIGWFIDDVLIYEGAPPQVTINTSGLISSYPATVHFTQAGVPQTATTYGSWSDTVDYGTAVSIDSSIGVSATERYGTNAITSWTATEVATYAVPYYHQFKPLVSVVAAGAGHVDLDSTNFATLTYYRYGSQGVFGVFDSHSFSDWADAGSSLTLSSLSSGSTSTHRWYSSEATSWTVNDAGSHSATYWDQLKPTVSVATAGTGHADLSTTNYVTLSWYRFGAAGTSNVFDAQGFNDWVDTGSTVSLSSSSSASTVTHRWYAAGTTSWVVNDADARSATYWEQFKPTVSVATAGTGHADLSASNYVTLSYYVFGAAVTANVFDAQGFSDWVDTGSAIGLSGSSSASTATHRWYAAGNTSWVVNDADSKAATYWEQFKPTVSVATAGTGHADLSATNHVTLSCYRFGAAGTAYVFDAQSFNDWVDMGSAASLSNPSSASTSTHRWYTLDTASWTVNDASARSATYWEQYKPTVAIEGLSPSHPTEVAFTTAGEPMKASTSDVWSDWVDAGSVVSTSKSIEGGWIGDWHAGDADELTADSAFSVTIDYRRSHEGIYILVGVLLVVAIAVGAGLFFFLRRHKREA